MLAKEARGFRLSPQQRRVWSLSQGDSRHRLEVCLSVSPEVGRQQLRCAIEAVVQEHEILRTAFVQLPGVRLPVQAPQADSTVVWREASLDEGREVTEQLASIRSVERSKAFELQAGRVLHATWVDGGERGRWLLLSVSALCADSRTMENLLRAIAAAHDGTVDNHGEELPYAQFAEWQNGLLEEEDAREGSEFWRSQNLDRVPRPSLPFEGTEDEADVVMEVDSGWTVPSALVEGMDRLAADRDASPAAPWLAAWCVLLSRLCGGAGVLVGDVAEGREHEILQTALGRFARRVPVHLTLRPELPFGDLVQQAEQVRSAAHDWSDYFVWNEVGLGAPEGAPEQLTFGFQYEEFCLRYPVEGGELTVEDRFLCGETCPISLYVTRSDEGLRVELQRDPSRLGSEDGRRILGYLQNVVESAVADSGVALAALQLLGDEERHWLIEELNRTETEQPPYSCFHQWFSAVAEEQPESPAVVLLEDRLSYRELEERSNRLARYLRLQGIGAEIPVGVLVDRSLDALVAILGIWKAGGVYVPLDPTQPEMRLAFLLQDSGVELVLTQEALQGILPADGVRSFALDRRWSEVEEYPAGRLSSWVGSDHLAYVIYTSGSSGRPKGVMVRHGSLVHLAEALRHGIYRDEKVRRVSLNAPFTFDASIKQIVTLAFGMTLDLVPEDVRSRADATLEHLAAQSIGAFDCTPFQLRLLLEAGWHDAEDARPQIVLIGGEKIDEELWESLRIDSETRFFNVYGPTECTVDVTAQRIGEGEAEPVVGRPLANVRTYVLDRNLRPEPRGVVGELCVGGLGLARGYLGRPALTASAFVPDPFGTDGGRLYRTGDLASHRPDGKLRLLGRIDRQVKVRGYRVEMGEIEHVLRTREGVRDVVVTVRRDEESEPHLVAYFVATPRAPATAADLYEALRRLLPEYMVPAALVPIPEMPLTRNGKVDLAALPDPEDVTVESGEYVAPQTEIQKLIAQIWKEELKVDRVGVRDNFFDLGGHSLLMAQVHTRLREELDQDISMIEMFRLPTVERLAEYFSGQQESIGDKLDQAFDRAARRRSRRNLHTA